MIAKQFGARAAFVLSFALLVATPAIAQTAANRAVVIGMTLEPPLLDPTINEIGRAHV